MFAIERSTSHGPQGGKPRGYCLAWNGRGEAPGARARRSGWYRHRADALSACDAANREAARLAARPAIEPENTGKGFAVAVIGPAGERLFLAYGPHTPDGRDATRFASEAVANRAGNAAIYGKPGAF